MPSQSNKVFWCFNSDDCHQVACTLPNTWYLAWPDVYSKHCNFDGGTRCETVVQVEYQSIYVGKINFTSSFVLQALVANVPSSAIFSLLLYSAFAFTCSMVFHSGCFQIGRSTYLASTEMTRMDLVNDCAKWRNWKFFWVPFEN